MSVISTLRQPCSIAKLIWLLSCTCVQLPNFFGLCLVHVFNCQTSLASVLYTCSIVKLIWLLSCRCMVVSKTIFCPYSNQLTLAVFNVVTVEFVLNRWQQVADGTVSCKGFLSCLDRPVLCS